MCDLKSERLPLLFLPRTKQRVFVSLSHSLSLSLSLSLSVSETFPPQTIHPLENVLSHAILGWFLARHSPNLDGLDLIRRSSATHPSPRTVQGRAIPSFGCHLRALGASWGVPSQHAQSRVPRKYNFFSFFFVVVSFFAREFPSRSSLSLSAPLVPQSRSPHMKANGDSSS